MAAGAVRPPVPRYAASRRILALVDHNAPAFRSALGTLSLTSRPLLTGYRPREAVTIARTPALTNWRRQRHLWQKLRGQLFVSP